MANLFETVYNTLSDLFVGNGLQSSAELPGATHYKEPELLKAASPEEMAEVALQHQQRRHLDTQFLQLVSSDKDKKLSYEPNRMMQYMDYVQMEGYPIVNSALNLLAEEATTVGQDGKVLRVYSSNKRVKQVLENLFYNTLDVNTTLQFWARNLCKYGDNFVYLLLNDKNGIEGYKQLSAFDMERKEEIINNRISVTYKHKNSQQQLNEYNIWQIAHFRLLGDERRMPYGMSVLDSVRRTWKMLNMCEDAMMVYRITRAAERRIFKVNIGNAKDSEEAKQIIQAVMQRHKNSRLVDNMTGDFNWKYNVASNDQDIYVPVRSENAGSMIETLAGASNLDAISDISYLRDNLFTGLGIPKSFLGFSEGGGDGKALSMLDIRFARKVNRIQQSLVAELNKIAIIHLALLGGDYMEHLNNFTITLSNPSTQSELLKIETIKAKLEAYVSAVTPSEKGIAPMSESMAAREILGISDEDRIDDLQEQFLESKVGDEIKSAGQLLKSSQLYDKMIKYKNAGFGQTPTSSGDTSGDSMGGGGMGGGMGGDLGLGGDAAGGGGVDMDGPSDGDVGNAPGSMPLSENYKPGFKRDIKGRFTKPSLFEQSMLISSELKTITEQLESEYRRRKKKK